jgi:alpha-tubulin suppressor-like RCC1 family protein
MGVRTIGIFGARRLGAIAASWSLAASGWFGCASLVGVDEVSFAGDADAEDHVPGDAGAGDGCKGICQLSAGWKSACALRDDGRIQCWGNNYSGALGHSPEADPVCVVDAGTDAWPFAEWPCAWQPQFVAGVVDAVQVSVGVDLACAVLADGGTLCWGSSDRGQLGHDPALTSDPVCPSAALRDAGFEGGPCRPEPSPVPGLPAAAQVAAGGQFACAVTRASEVYCWGDNSGKQLGSATAGAFAPTPVRVDGVAGATEVSVSMHDTPTMRHACARLSDGAVTCWGSNTQGELGYDSGGDPDHVCVDQLCNREARTVSGLPRAAHVRVGEQYTCAVTDDPDAANPLYCWGQNEYVTFAAGVAPLRSSTPVPAIALPANDIRRAVQLETRWVHTALLDESGAVWTWGDNRYGALGTPRVLDVAGCPLPYPCQRNPVKLTSLAGRVALIAVGTQMTFAKLEDGAVFGWGVNFDGRLGHAPDTDVTCDWPGVQPYSCSGRAIQIDGLR